ncbi:expressed unknown protein [Seminavis robusta]|uniref:Uncharacterized protein n=1 Tax=Seminavis robusta TaxID=568900 RepID=A0A9N8H9Q6_9STRA|nr:expressed unknown protein [Seminavis robusta]|eukprot:Sro264_g102460.1 n/a (627) ;mRNA; r:11022-13281
MTLKISSLFCRILPLALLLPTACHAQIQKYFTNEVNERAGPCPDDPLQIGYKHIIDVNTDQQTESDRVAAGQAPRTPYVFPLCNRFKYLMEERVLEVILPDITFVCGYNGTNVELCVLDGNEFQVNVAPGSTTTNATFAGISFFSYTGVAVKAYGDVRSNIRFNDVKFQGFQNSATAIHQSNPVGDKPMNVFVDTVLFENGVGRHLIDNEGGTLIVNDLTIGEGVIADSVIRTSKAGTSTLKTASATLSDLVRFTQTEGGSTHTVTGLTVTEMNSLGTVLYVTDGGSYLSATNVNVNNIRVLEAYRKKFMEDFTVQTSRNFNVLVATDQATADGTSFTVKDSDGVDRVFSASNGAVVNIHDSSATNLVGTSPPDLLSNVAMAEDGGSMNVLRLQVANVEWFSTVFCAICGSTIQVLNSCVDGGRVSAPAFKSADSTIDPATSNNYMNVEELTADRCFNNQQASVFSEQDTGEACFSETGTGACEGQCIAGFADAGECMVEGGPAAAQVTPSVAPPAQANPSCPASPPTPVPTLPPGFTVNGIPPGGGEPVVEETIPPGNPGGAPLGGGTPGSSPGGSPGSPGGSGGDGVNSAEPPSGDGSSANQYFHAFSVAGALVMARLVHRVLF